MSAGDSAAALRWWRAPAKLNLCLHVVGRRADGYHELQTVFQLIDLCDMLAFEVDPTGGVTRVDDGAAAPGVLAAVAPDADLTVRAARALQAASGTSLGARIRVRKRIPMGGGLGGGSSDAATTLRVLDRMWGTALGTDALARASVPSAVPHMRSSTRSVVAASELPPPRPPPIGMRLRTRIRAPSDVPEAACRARAARTVRSASGATAASTPGAAAPSSTRVTPPVGSTSNASMSQRSISWNTVCSSWYPSARRPTTCRQRLSLAGARHQRSAAAESPALMAARPASPRPAAAGARPRG